MYSSFLLLQNGVAKNRILKMSVENADPILTLFQNGEKMSKTDTSVTITQLVRRKKMTSKRTHN